MTYTTAEILSVDGVVLNTLAKNIEELTGRLRTPKAATDNIAVPKRNGRIRVSQKFYDQNEITLPMWVIGSDDDGKIPGGSTEAKEFWKNLDTLTALFGLRSSPLDIRHTLADGSVRQCYGDVLETISFEVEMLRIGRFTVVITVPDPFWQDVNSQTQSITLPNGSGSFVQSYSLTTFLGATAPIEDMTFTFTGPVTNPMVEALVNSSPLQAPIWFRYNGTVGAGTTLVANCSTWALSGSMSPTYSLLSHVGSPRWMVVQPNPAASSPEIRVSGSNTSAATKVEVSGRRKFLVG